MNDRFDAIVLGMGPGGEVAAPRLLAAGKRVAVVERELIGGECAYWACIPSKTLLRPPEARAEADRAAGVDRPALHWPALRDYRDWMIRHLDDSGQITGYEKQGATVVKGAGRLAGRNAEGLLRVETDARTLQAEHVIIATGSEAVRPPVEGLAEVPVWTNREATTLVDIPQRVLVLGGSAVAVELGQFLARMGAHVTLVERGDRLVTGAKAPSARGLVSCETTGRELTWVWLSAAHGCQQPAERRRHDDPGRTDRRDRAGSDSGLGLAAAGGLPVRCWRPCPRRSRGRMRVRDSSRGQCLDVVGKGPDRTGP